MIKIKECPVCGKKVPYLRKHYKRHTFVEKFGRGKIEKKRGGEGGITFNEVEPLEFRVNKYITLKLEEGEIRLYVNNKRLVSRYSLLLGKSLRELVKEEELYNTETFYDFLLNSSPSGTPEEEFKTYCSKFQKWNENNYDSSLLGNNVVYPLLKKLISIGDQKARRVYKEEVKKGLINVYPPTLCILFEGRYIKSFRDGEFVEILSQMLPELLIFKTHPQYREVLYWIVYELYHYGLFNKHNAIVEEFILTILSDIEEPWGWGWEPWLSDLLEIITFKPLIEKLTLPIIGVLNRFPDIFVQGVFNSLITRIGESSYGKKYNAEIEQMFKRALNELHNIGSIPDNAYAFAQLLDAINNTFLIKHNYAIITEFLSYLLANLPSKYLRNDIFPINELKQSISALSDVDFRLQLLDMINSHKLQDNSNKAISK